MMERLKGTVPRRLRLAVLLVVSMAGCGGSDALLGPDAPQGIDGIVLIGPQCPVASPDNPCPDLPYKARIDVSEAAGSKITTIQSGDDGHFRVGLAPGTYRLHPISGDPLPLATDQVVLVREGVWADVTINYDTGIR